MRRIAFTCLCLALPGCGYNTWWNPPFTSGSNPNFPAGDSENMRRVTGEQVDSPMLTPEPGDIWPGPLPGHAAAQSAATAREPRQFDAAALQPARPDAAAGSDTAASDRYDPARPQSGRSGLHHATGSRGLRRRHQRLPDHHSARRRLGHSGAQWQWHQYDHTFGWQDRDGPHTTLKSPWPMPKRH